jgi:hypothetical protein
MNAKVREIPMVEEFSVTHTMVTRSLVHRSVSLDDAMAKWKALKFTGKIVIDMHSGGIRQICAEGSERIDV